MSSAESSQARARTGPEAGTRTSTGPENCTRLRADNELLRSRIREAEQRLSAESAARHRERDKLCLLIRPVIEERHRLAARIRETELAAVTQRESGAQRQRGLDRRREHRQAIGGLEQHNAAAYKRICKNEDEIVRLKAAARDRKSSHATTVGE